MARHDIRDPVTGKFGKRLVASTYSSDEFPTVTERHDNQRATPEPKFGSNHPDFPSKKGLVLTTKSSLLGDDNEEVRTRGYETLPSFPLETTTVSRDTEGGTQVTTTLEVNLADTPVPAEPLAFGTNSASLQATSAIKGTLTTVTQDHPPRTGQVVNDTTLGSIGTVTIQTLPAGTPALAPSLNLVSSEEQPTDTAHVDRTDTKVIEWPVFTTLENTRIGRQITLIPAKFVGGDELTETHEKVVPGTKPERISTTVLSSVVTQEAEARSQKVTVTRPNTAYPTLTGSEMSNFAGGQAAVTTDQIVAAGTPAATGFGIISSASEPIDTFYNELRTTFVTSFPELAFSTIGRPAEVYPGKYGYGNTGGESGVEQVVPSGTTPIGSGVVLSREPINEFEDKVRVGTVSAGSGIENLNGSETGRFGTIARSWTLNDTALASGLHVLDSRVQPAGGGLMEVETSTSADSAVPTTLEYQGLRNIPERFLLGLERTTTETPVAPGTAANTADGVLLSIVVPSESNSARYVKKDTTLPSGYTLPTLTGVEIARDADGELVTETEQVVDVGTAEPAIAFTTLGYKDQPLGGGKLLRTARTLSGGSFPVLNDYDVFDPRYNVRIHETQQIVDTSSVTQPVEPSGGASTTFKAIDKWRSIQTVRSLVVPSSIPDRYAVLSHAAPSILTSITINAGPGGQSVINYNIRKGFPFLALTRLATNIGSGLSSDALASTWKPADIRYTGVLFNLYIPNVLTNAFSITFSTGSSGPLFQQYGSVTETFSYEATDPSADEYIALIGNEIIIKSDMNPYHWGLQEKTTTYFRPQ